MGEIRFVGTGETHGYPYLVCKKEKSDLRDPNFNQGQSLPRVKLPYLHGLAHNRLFFFHF